MRALLFLFSFLFLSTALGNFNSRIPVQGFLKYAGEPLNNATGFPIKYLIKKNGNVIWCQTSAANVPVFSGVLSSILTGNSNCESLSNSFSSNLFTHSSDTDSFSFDIIVDVAADGFSGGDDVTFSGIDLLPAPLALHASHALTADSLKGTVPVSQGGTGGTSAVSARSNLGLGSLALVNVSGNSSHVLFGDGTFGSLPVVNFGGDLTGTPSNGTVTKIQGRSVSASAPTAGQILSWDGVTSSWVPSSLSSTNIGDVSSINAPDTLVKRDASGNFSAGTITGTLVGTSTNVTGTVAMSNGGTGATTPAEARLNLGAAKSGVNTDITSISGAAMLSSAVSANASGGTTTAYTLTNSPALTSLTTGLTVFLRINALNTGPATLDVDGLGAQNIFSALTNTAVSAGSLKINSVVRLTYDGTQWLAEITPHHFTAAGLNCGTSVTARNSVICPNIAAATAAAGDIVQCSPSADPSNTAGKIQWSAFATAGNISIRLSCSNNTTACAITNRNWRCIVFK